jgi:hypothetical protein
MDIGEIGCEDRWKELAKNEVQWQASVLSVLNLWVPLPVLVRFRNHSVQHKQTIMRYKTLNTNLYITY